MKEKKWRIELTEHQLRLIANCVEDCCRFIGGQMELCNSTNCLERYSVLWEELDKLQPLVTPEISKGACYGWNGGSCTNKDQRKFIAETYYIYRKIYEEITKNRTITEHFPLGNKYLSETLRCKDSGEPIKVERME